MKLSATLPHDKQIHTYCLNCMAEEVEPTKVDGMNMFHCRSCDEVKARALIIDPKIKWWVDETQEYWHESAGLFIVNPAKELLLFELTKYPFGFTVPAGHIDAGESPEVAALRELEEETSIKGVPVHRFITTDIHGDGCRRGADVHKWHCFTSHVPTSTQVTINDEGMRPVWVNLEQATSKELTFAVRYVLEHHKDALLSIL